MVARLRVVLPIRSLLAKGETTSASRFADETVLERAVEGVENEVRIPACAYEKAFPIV